jgi:hypothetical protein
VWPYYGCHRNILKQWRWHCADGTSSIIFAKCMSASAFEIGKDGGMVEYAPTTQLHCLPGEPFLYNFTTIAETIDGWKIDCSVVRSFDSGSWLEFTSPSCTQLQIGDSPLRTEACADLPLNPAMLTTMGSVTCSPCTVDMHGPIRSTVTGGTNVEHPHGTCVQCGVHSGRYSDVPGLADCKGCPAGSVAKVLACSQCGPGHFAADTAQLECDQREQR